MTGCSEENRLYALVSVTFEGRLLPRRWLSFKHPSFPQCSKKTRITASVFHVCPDSYNTCSEDFEGVKLKVFSSFVGEKEVVTILTCMILLNNVQ